MRTRRLVSKTTYRGRKTLREAFLSHIIYLTLNVLNILFRAQSKIVRLPVTEIMPVSGRTYERWSEKSVYTILIDELHLSSSKNRVRCTSWGTLRLTTCHASLFVFPQSSPEKSFTNTREAHLTCLDNRHTGAFIMSGSDERFIFSSLLALRPPFPSFLSSSPISSWN